MRDEHLLIKFRDGPTGRRAGLIGGPDVWEVAVSVDELRSAGEDPAELVTGGTLTWAQIDAAERYRAAYPDEVEARIELHRRETGAADRR